MSTTASGRRWTLALAVVLVGAIATVRFVAPPDAPPDYEGERPSPVASGYVAHTETVFVAVSPESFEAWVNTPGRALGDIVETGDGLSPVASTHPLRGDWDPAGDRSGDRRRVEFADGHFLAEEVLIDTPERFRYMIWGFTGYQRVAVQHAVAEFRYEPRPDGMQLTWTYSFLPTSGLLRPFVANFVESSIAPMMRGTLEGMRLGAEQALRP